MNIKYILTYEKKLYFSNNKELIKEFIFSSNKYMIWLYVKYLRKEEHYRTLIDSNMIYLPLLVFYRRKKNILGRRLGFDIPAGVFEPGLLIWHQGTIVVNPFAKVGKNAVIVGNLCIGNNGGKKAAPQIGDDCMFGWDATVIGGGQTKIGNRCKIGAKALVNQSFEEDDAILVGVPAKNITNEAIRGR